MKKALAIISLFPILPTIALAQTLSAQGFIAGFLAFTNSVLIPFLLGFAFLFFVFNAFRFFIVNGSNEEGQKNAKNLAVYGVLAFVVLVVFWGVVNLLASSAGFSKGQQPTPDYVENNGGDFKPSPSARKACPDGSTPNVHGVCDDPIGDLIEKNLPPEPAPGEPINLLPPQYDVPTENVRLCGDGSTYNAQSNTCDYQ